MTSLESPTASPSTSTYREWGIFAIAMLLVAGVFIYFFSQIEIVGGLAYDRRILRAGVQHWVFGQGMSNPPWSVMLIYPLEALPLHVGWGILGFLLFTGLVVSVPRFKHWTFILLIVGLQLSFITLRNYAEGNYDAIVLWGILFIVWGYEKKWPLLIAAGILLATIKIQTCFLLLLILPWYLRSWSWRQKVAVYGTVALVVLPSLVLWGREWYDSLSYFSIRSEQIWYEGLNYLPSSHDLTDDFPFLTIVYLIIRGGLILGALWFARRFSYEGLGLLLVAGLMTAPYANELSLILALVFGVTRLFVHGYWIAGIILLVSYQNLRTIGFGSYDYWFFVLSITYLVLVWLIIHLQKAPTEPETPSQTETPERAAFSSL